MDDWTKESVRSWTSESGWAGPLDAAAGMVEIGSAWIGDDGVGDQAWVDVPAAVLRDLLPIPSPAECRSAARSISQETVERWLWSHGWEPYSDMEPGWWTHSEHPGQYIVRPAAFGEVGRKRDPGDFLRYMAAAGGRWPFEVLGELRTIQAEGQR